MPAAGRPVGNVRGAGSGHLVVAQGFRCCRPCAGAGSRPGVGGHGGDPARGRVPPGCGKGWVAVQAGGRGRAASRVNAVMIWSGQGRPSAMRSQVLRAVRAGTCRSRWRRSSSAQLWASRPHRCRATSPTWDSPDRRAAARPSRRPVRRRGGHRDGRVPRTWPREPATAGAKGGTQPRVRYPRPAGRRWRSRPCR
jgi:hypothetical protein